MTTDIAHHRGSRMLFSVFGILALFQFLDGVTMFADARPGALTSLAIGIALLIHFPKLVPLLLRPANAAFDVFFAIVLASLLNYAFNATVLAYTAQYPATIFTTFSYLILPSLFFYLAGNWIGSAGEDVVARVFGVIVWLNMVCIVSAIILHLTHPDFYVSFLMRILEDNIILLPRMAGYLGNSMMMGAVCASTVPIIWRMRWQRGLKLTLTAICVTGSVLTLQRGSMLACVLVLMTFGTISARHYGVARLLLRRGFSVLLVGGMVVGIVAWLWRAGLINTWLDLFSALTTRELTASGLLEDRTDQWANVGKVLAMYPMGMGIGMLSHVTAITGFALAIPDGNYLRILGELGPLGAIAFFALLASSVYRGWQRGDLFLCMAIGTLAIQAIGTNVFDFYYSGFLFWLYMGMASAVPRLSKPQPVLLQTATP